MNFVEAQGRPQSFDLSMSWPERFESSHRLNVTGSNKVRALAVDALIALSARDIRATVITCDREDFEEIRRQRLFKVLYW